MNLVLSHTLFNICNRSNTFRRNYRRDNLNVCNVIRALVWVILVWDVLVPSLCMFALDVIVKVPFIMAYTLDPNPFTALDLAADVVVRKGDFVWGSFQNWWSVASFFMSAIVTIVTIGAACIGAVGIVVYLISLAMERFYDFKSTSKVLEKVLGPADLVGEYLGSKHSKFCLNIKAQVKKTYAEELREQTVAEIANHWCAARDMSKETLLASIDKNRAILSKYA